MSEIERAIETLNDADTWKLIVWGTPSFPAMLNRLTSACLLARDVLTAELSRQENAPLTWEELVSMTRKTVYIVDRTDDEKSGWAIVGKQYIKIGLEFITLCENLAFRRELKELYGQTWIAYRHEPKGEPPCTQD